MASPNAGISGFRGSAAVIAGLDEVACRAALALNKISLGEGPENMGVEWAIAVERATGCDISGAFDWAATVIRFVAPALGCGALFGSETAPFQAGASGLPPRALSGGAGDDSNQ